MIYETTEAGHHMRHYNNARNKRYAAQSAHYPKLSGVCRILRISPPSHIRPTPVDTVDTPPDSWDIQEHC